MLRSISPERFANFSSPFRGLYFLVRISSEWLCFVALVFFVVGCLSLYSPSPLLWQAFGLVIAFGYVVLCQVPLSPLSKNKFCVKVWRVGGCVFFPPSFRSAGSLPNKACTRRVGVCGIYKHFSGFGLFLYLKPFPRPPTRG